MTKRLILSLLCCAIALSCQAEDSEQAASLPPGPAPRGLLVVSVKHPRVGERIALSADMDLESSRGLLVSFSNGVTASSEPPRGGRLALTVPDGAQGPSLFVHVGSVTKRADLMVRYPQGTVDAMRVTPELARPGDVITVVTGNQKHAGITDDEELRVRIDGIEVPAEPVDLAHVKFTLPAMEMGEHRLVIVTRAGSAGSVRLIVK